MKMKVLKKGSIITMILVLSMICGSVSNLSTKHASAKVVSKMTKTFTIKMEKNPEDTGTYVCHGIRFNKKEKIGVKVKILQVKGKLSKRAAKEIMFGYFEDGDGKGSVFTEKMNKNSFKKGKVLGKKNMGGYYLQDPERGKARVEWTVPDGIKLIKMKVTYYTRSGKAGIKSIKNLSPDDIPNWDFSK